jgi:hypothetical protein
MNKWIPYVIAAALGLGVALLAFGPGMRSSAKPATPEKAEQDADKKPSGRKDFGDKGFAVFRKEDDTRTSEEVVADARANPPPPPGTLRPQNKAEIEHAARLARPFNQHYAYVASFWGRTAQLVGGADPALAKECSAMSRYLRDQGNLDDDGIDIAGTIEKEKALVAKVRGASDASDELTGVLDYIEASGKAVIDGQDPTTVPKPSARK